MKPTTRRTVCFVTFCAVVSIAVGAYVIHAKSRSQRLVHAASVPPPVSPDQPKLGKGSLQRQNGCLAFRNTALGPDYGRVSFVPLDSPDSTRVATQLDCERVYASPHGGIALQAARNMLVSYRAVLFDAEATIKATFSLPGIPSRARISPDGAYAAMTVFVSGDSYNSVGFSTRTTIIDLRSASVIADLEQFSVEKDGQAFKRIDFNFWGVTFLPSDGEFYATLATGGQFFLAKGSIPRRRVRVVRDGVECPSLSPDGNRIAYKARTMQSGRLLWRLRVFNLSTSEEHTVNEERSVDDQAEWFDAEHVLYALPRNISGDASADIWMARADGTGTPRILVRDAWSPSVIRPESKARMIAGLQ